MESLSSEKNKNQELIRKIREQEVESEGLKADLFNSNSEINNKTREIQVLNEKFQLKVLVLFFPKTVLITFDY